MSRLFADALRGQRAWTPEEIERLRQGQQVPVQNNAGLPMDPGVFRQQEAANPTGIVEPPPSLAQAVAGGAAFAPMRPAVDRTVTVRGMSPSLGMEEAQYDFAGNAFAGGRTGGQSFQDFSAFQQAIERGRQGQAPAGVPSADYLSSAVLGRAMPGGLPHLDQQRNLAAVQLQQQYADRQNLLDRQQLANQGELDRTRVAVEGKTPGSEEKARLAAEAAVAQAIQGGFTPEAGGAPAAGGAAPAQSSALADQILGAVMPTSRNAQGVMARGAFTPEGLARIPPELLANPQAVSQFASAARTQLQPSELAGLQDSLAQQMAQAYLRTAPMQIGKTQPGTVDLEKGLLRLGRDQQSLGTLTNLATGGFGYNLIHLPQQLGGRTIKLDNSPGVFTRGNQGAVAEADWRKRYEATRQLLGALASQQR
jgi:hypothetical protein